MKFVKGISIFVIYPLVMLGLGFFSGIWAYRFFYPGYGKNTVEIKNIDQTEYVLQQNNDITDETTDDVFDKADDTGLNSDTGETSGHDSEELISESVDMESVAAANVSETLTADTEYVLEETDVLKNTVVETVWSLPHKYIGMNREQFLESIGTYGENPPLSELERGFIGLEVLSFSKDRVVIQMNYKYVQPGDGFYLAAYDNEVIVYLEDMETVYINTGIRLDMLPEDMQTQIIQMMWMPDEKSLYGFLEAYSS